MGEMISRERIQRLFRRQPIDRMPVFSGLGTVVLPALDRLDVPFSAVHTRADLMAEAALTSARMFGMDGAVVPYDVTTVAEAAGCGIRLYTDVDETVLYPTVQEKWSRMEDVCIPEDILSRGRLPLVDQALKTLIRDTDLATGTWILGPFTLAGQLVDLKVLYKGMRKFPEKTATFLDLMTRLTISLARHYEALGVDYLTVREMGACADLVSAGMWRTFVGPNLARVFAAVDIPTVNHICGATGSIVEMMRDCGADAISVDQKTDVAATRNRLGDQALIFGNFDPVFTLCSDDTTATMVTTIIRQCIDDGVDAVWPGCDIWPSVIAENMRAYVQTVIRCGAKPTPAVGRIPKGMVA